ncbi:MAG: preprotein translocase subunit SecA [Nitrospinae bacterium]|nr:preprotein translocase subunit SecA [Nitrospinota bacterium]
MFGNIVKKIFGSRNDRELARIRLIVDAVNALEPATAAMDDAGLKGKTAEFVQRVENGETLEAILPEAFAVCREASKRTLNMRHFDEQLMGGVVLHEGRIAEMKTGEGKTLVATLPLYLNALSKKGAHLVTVNDYLARRDAEWMGKIYSFLGLTFGVIQHGLDDEERQAAYNSDITYCTNNELGFDYLRDNMKFDAQSCVQRELNFALVDEVDSILIDEARTPLIISGQAEESTDKYMIVNRIVPKLLKKDTLYTLDEKARTVALTELGVSTAEELLDVGNLYDPRNVELLHHVNQAMKAHVLFKLDVDYVVKDGEVLIVDEFTGRLMPGRRYSDGLHQALEAKEGVKIENENQTLATITFQNFFRIYNKLAGMTGTADTEATEFNDIYKLEVIIVPTHRNMVRKDHADLIYRTAEEKYEAIIDEIVETHGRGQPALVGTISIEKSEKLSAMLKRKGVRHNVLNAKQHEREAEIVAQAGRQAAVTIATNMAGRGTDIILGGNPEMLLKTEGVTEDESEEEYAERKRALDAQCEEERKAVLEAGGLKIIGTERHESRRIDNQLRGRSGRQGDPGESRFYLSMEDDLMRIFGSDKLSTVMEKLGMERGEPIEHSMVSKALEGAQKRVEAHNYDIRKHLLEYDDVMNKQREVIYSQRRMILEGADLKATVLDMADEYVEQVVGETMPENSHPEDWDWEGLKIRMMINLGLVVEGDKNTKAVRVGTNGSLNMDTVLPHELAETAKREVNAAYEAKEAEIGEEKFRGIQQYVMLNVLDGQWKEQLLIMDHLKQGIGFRGYAQKNPLSEYKREGHEMFEEMIARFRQEVTAMILKVQVDEKTEAPPLELKAPTNFVAMHGNSAEEPRAAKKDANKVGRNDPCPCGSGKKYKKCHGK